MPGDADAPAEGAVRGCNRWPTSFCMRGPTHQHRARATQLSQALSPRAPLCDATLVIASACRRCCITRRFVTPDPAPPALSCFLPARCMSTDPLLHDILGSSPVTHLYSRQQAALAVFHHPQGIPASELPGPLLRHMHRQQQTTLVVVLARVPRIPACQVRHREIPCGTCCAGPAHLCSAGQCLARKPCMQALAWSCALNQPPTSRCAEQRAGLTGHQALWGLVCTVLATYRDRGCRW